MGEEAQFVMRFRDTIARMCAKAVDARLVQPLADAWQRLQRNGARQMRKIEKRIRQIEPTRQAYAVVTQQSVTAPGRRSCALDSCGSMEGHPAHFKHCSACRAVVYCSPEHQAADWPSHKAACKAARKARSEHSGPSGA